jgi:SAM-dependent methyltransferase
MTTTATPAQDWFTTPLGSALLGVESQAVAAALEQVFGFQCLQVGRWGPPGLFLGHARTQRSALIAAEVDGGGNVRSRAAELAVQADSVDAVLLPHTLECEPEPHEVLREVGRILVGEGHLVVLGFEPLGPWAMRQRLARHAFVPGVRRTLAERRLRDWLQLLGFEVLEVRRYLFAPPLARLQSGSTEALFTTLGRRLWPRLSGAYLLKARKRVYCVRPIRLPARPLRAVVTAAQPARRVGT